jgi:hypothetical protein
MSTDLMGQAISWHFKLTSKFLPFPFSWDQKTKELKYRNFTHRFIPWYCMTFVVLPVKVSICIGLLFYEIIQRQRTMNYFQLLVLIAIIVAATTSIICAANNIHFSDDWVSCFNQLFPLRNIVSKGSKLHLIQIATC